MKTFKVTRIDYGNGHWSRAHEYVQAEDVKEATELGRHALGEVSLVEEMPKTFKVPGKLTRDDLSEDAKAIGLEIIKRGTE